MPLKKTDRLTGFEDKNRLTDVSIIPYETGAYAPVLLSQDVMNTVSIRFTGAQYTQLLSSALTGALLLYPDNPLYAVFPLLECVDMPINNCDAFAECISTSESVRDALSQWFSQTEYAANIDKALAMLASAGTGYNPAAGGCSEDALFGTVTDVFDELYQSGLDWLEILDQALDFTEQMVLWGEELTALALAAGAVPATVVGVLTVVSNVVEQFITDMIQAYQAGYTTELRDQLRCEFFCIVKDSCAFTAADILTWLESELTPNVNNITELVAWYFGVTGLSGRLSVLALWYFELALYRFAITNKIASIFAGQAATDAMVRLTRVAQAANPDPDWIVFCDSCSGPVPFVWLANFPADGLTVQNWRGEVAPIRTGAEGLEIFATVGQSGSNTGILVLLPVLDRAVQTVKLRVSWNATRLGDGRFRAGALQVGAIVGVATGFKSFDVSGSFVDVEFQLNSPMTQFRIIIDSECQTANDASFAILHRIELT